MYLFTDSGGGCFPSSARVNLPNGKVISMSELQIGDKVQTGIIINKEVYILLHCRRYARKWSLD